MVFTYASRQYDGGVSASEQRVQRKILTIGSDGLSVGEEDVVGLPGPKHPLNVQIGALRNSEGLSSHAAEDQDAIAHPVSHPAWGDELAHGHIGWQQANKPIIRESDNDLDVILLCG